MANIFKSPYVRVEEIRREKAKTAEAGASEPSQGMTQAEMQAAYEGILTAAKAEADTLLEEAKTQCEELLADSRRRGEEIAEDAQRQGYHQGMQKAAEEVAQILQKADQESEKLIEQAAQERNRLLDAVDSQILSLALDMSEKILAMELDRNDTAYTSMLYEALSAIKAERKVTLRVNPGEFVRFFKARDLVLHTPKGSIDASIISDPTVEFGGCLIETDTGAVDAGAHAQVDQLRRALDIETGPSEPPEQDG